MSQLYFRLCKAYDGLVYAFLTDQPESEDLFDNGYKVAYKHHVDHDLSKDQLPRWYSSYTVKSENFVPISEHDELPKGMQRWFDTMVSNLLVGVDVMFCDYNFGIEAHLPICNAMMDKYRSTDFVLFSCEELIGSDPSSQPYMVSYAVPRYPTQETWEVNIVYIVKTDSFAFARAISAIVNQRERDALNCGHIRIEVDDYISQLPVSEEVAKQIINRCIKALPEFIS